MVVFVGYALDGLVLPVLPDFLEMLIGNVVLPCLVPKPIRIEVDSQFPNFTYIVNVAGHVAPLPEQVSMAIIALRKRFVLQY